MRPSRGLLGPAAAMLTLIIIFAVGLGLGQISDFLPPLPTLGAAAAPSGGVPALPPSRPVGVVIPKIGVRAPVHSVGLAADGSIEAPAPERMHEAGWYDQGPTPGEYGPAIIVGHIDSRNGPAVFHRLNTLRPGETVEITRQDRWVAVFRVDAVEQFEKTNLPVADVYGDFSQPGLRLITCGGRWVGGETGYADNVIVFASLTGTRKP